MSLILSAEVDNALAMSKVDPEQAAEVLRIAARYLKNQQKMPDALAYFLADSIERAMKKASIVRGTELLRNLNLEVTNRRPSANFEYVGFDLDELLKADVPKGQAIFKLSETYGVSESTIKRMYKEYRAYRDSEAEADASFFEEEQRDYAQRSLIKKSE